MPMRYQITAPTTGHTGLIAGVRFTAGHAEAIHPPPGALEYFRRRGYTVTPLDDRPSNGPQEDKPAARSRTRTKHPPRE
jgi:hypothetical protein